jgi:hypothetical protein
MERLEEFQQGNEGGEGRGKLVFQGFQGKAIRGFFTGGQAERINPFKTLPGYKICTPQIPLGTFHNPWKFPGNSENFLTALWEHCLANPDKLRAVIMDFFCADTTTNSSITNFKTTRNCAWVKFNCDPSSLQHPDFA